MTGIDFCVLPVYGMSIFNSLSGELGLFCFLPVGLFVFYFTVNCAQENIMMNEILQFHLVVHLFDLNSKNTFQTLMRPTGLSTSVNGFPTCLINYD